jgi:hypothetical protein
MHEFMGVRVAPLKGVPEIEVELITEPPLSIWDLRGESPNGYALDPRQNTSYEAVNRLLDAGVHVWRSTEPVTVGVKTLSPGAFVVDGSQEVLEKTVSDLDVTFYGVEGNPALLKVKKPRIGLYQRYYGGNADEGWTRLVLEQFGFSYETLKDSGVDDELSKKLDVIVLPSDPSWAILGEDVEEHFDLMGRPLPRYPEKYMSGIGKEGADRLATFVSEGGTLVCLNESCMFAVEAFQLSLADSTEELSKQEFFCPASTLHVQVDTGHPLGYGMMEDSLLFFWDSPVLKAKPSLNSETIEVVARYPENQILESGWLDGEKHLAGNPALTVVKRGEGKIVLFGFRPQHRAQTHGTYKLLFNSFFL